MSQILSTPIPARRFAESAGALRRLLSRPLSASCATIVALYVAIALLTFLPAFQRVATAPLPPVPGVNADGAAVQFTEYAPPSFRQFPAYLFGTDIQNRSVFYRTLYGTRTALIITLCVSVIALSLGVVLGVLGGYFGGWIDDIVTWLVATFSAVPDVLLLLALCFVVKGLDLSVFGLKDADGTPLEVPGIIGIIVALSLTGWVGICRLVRGEVLKQRALDYVVAGAALGLSRRRVLFRHILPNCLHLVIINFTLGAIGYVQAEVFLTFLGLGITDKPSWGRMIDDAKLELLRGVWWQFTAATLAIGILSLALSLLGDALRDILDPRTRMGR